MKLNFKKTAAAITTTIIGSALLLQAGRQLEQPNTRRAQRKAAALQLKISNTRTGFQESRIAIFASAIATHVPTLHPHVWAEVADALNPRTPNAKNNNEQMIESVRVLDAAAKEANVHPASLLFALTHVNFDDAARMSEKQFAEHYAALLEKEGRKASKQAAAREAKKIFLLARHKYFGMQLADAGDSLNGSTNVYEKALEEYHEVGAAYDKLGLRKQ